MNDIHLKYYIFPPNSFPLIATIPAPTQTTTKVSSNNMLLFFFDPGSEINILILTFLLDRLMD